YTRASRPQRRAMHRRLSEVVSDPEERARHLAHAGVLPEAITALDEASRYVRARGAPEVAADLLELSLELGGPRELLARAAEDHFDAGDLPRPHQLAEQAIDALEPGEERADALRLLGELRFHADSYTGAREALEQARSEAGSNDRLHVAIGIELVHVYFQLGL